MTAVSIVLSTIDSNEQALKISEVLVNERFAACINILPTGITELNLLNGLQIFQLCGFLRETLRPIVNGMVEDFQLIWSGRKLHVAPMAGYFPGEIQS